MPRVYQIFRDRTGPYRAVSAGPAVAALPLPWAWAFAKGLWFRGLLLLGIDGLIGFLATSLISEQAAALGLALAVPRLVTFFKGNGWVAAHLESRGMEYLGEIQAQSAKDGVAQVARRGGQIPSELRPRSSVEGLTFPPPSWRPFLAVARLTIRAAFRYRLVIVLLCLLLGAVVVLPTVIKHDGTAQGFTQILLTYTLGITTALLSMVTLWLACGTLARDVDECQMQVVATKPIARWQIWLGKWTGIMALNVMLLAAAAGAVFFLMQWRARQLPQEIQQALHSNVLTARAVVKEPVPDLDARVEELVRARLPDLQARGVDVSEFRRQAAEVIKAREMSVTVPSDHLRRFRLDFRGAENSIQNQPVFVRVNFHTPELSAKRPYEIEVQVGPVDSPQRRAVFRSLAAEAKHEIPVGTVVLDRDGYLTVDVANRSDTPLIFPVDGGFEVLYREGGFGLNYVRAGMVILCWLGLLAAIGLAAASFLSFPVAAFVATTILMLAMSTGTLKTVVEDQTVLGFEHDTNRQLYPAVDAVMVPVFKLMLDTVNLAKQFSPIDSVSSGRSITWFEVGRAVLIVVGLMGGLCAAVGMVAFTRRELATAQSNQ